MRFVTHRDQFTSGSARILTPFPHSIQVEIPAFVGALPSSMPTLLCSFLLLRYCIQFSHATILTAESQVGIERIATGSLP